MKNELVATYIINNYPLEVYKCFTHSGNDAEVFYDFEYQGRCINLGEPWFDDGLGIPSKEEICEVFFS